MLNSLSCNSVVLNDIIKQSITVAPTQTQKQKPTVLDPSNSLTLMFKCLLHRQFTDGTKVNDVSVFNF